MKRLLTGITCGIALLLISDVETNADPEDCKAAIEQYNSAKSDLADALKKYSDCVNDSDGHDDCSTEFEEVKSTQDDFESAVSEYESECQ
jgi:hypothetical protein